MYLHELQVRIVFGTDKCDTLRKKRFQIQHRSRRLYKASISGRVAVMTTEA